MIQDLLNFTVLAFMCAVCGFVYTNILTDPDEIFDNLYSCLERKLKEKHPKWFKVLIGCEKCVSGQMALWTLVFLGIKDVLILRPQTVEEKWNLFLELFHPLNVIYTISAAIFIAYLLAKFYQWTKTQKKPATR